MFRRPWLVPLVMIAVLLFAWLFRWEETSSISQGLVKAVYYRDRWTNQTWVAVFGSTYDAVFTGDKRPLFPGRQGQAAFGDPEMVAEAERRRDNMTHVWATAVVLCLLWTWRTSVHNRQGNNNRGGSAA